MTQRIRINNKAHYFLNDIRQKLCCKKKTFYFRNVFLRLENIGFFQIIISKINKYFGDCVLHNCVNVVWQFEEVQFPLPTIFFISRCSHFSRKCLSETILNGYPRDNCLNAFPA